MNESRSAMAQARRKADRIAAVEGLLITCIEEVTTQAEPQMGSIIDAAMDVECYLRV